MKMKTTTTTKAINKQKRFVFISPFHHYVKF